MSSTTSSTEIKASVLHGPKDLKIETRTLPTPLPDELQIAVRATGLCGSDLHYYTHGRNGDFVVREPLSLGHESAGIVTSVGSFVSGFSVGDKVALEVGQPCSDCARCKEGRYNLCKGMRFRSSAKSFPHFQGTLQERINHPAEWCYKLPESVSLEVGALLEPLGVALHAVRRARLEKGASVLVFGAGAVGLLCAAAAKLRGAGHVTIADIDQGRVEFAVKNRFADACYTVPMKRGSTTEENLEIAKGTASVIGELKTSGNDTVGEVDATFECTGMPSCVQASIYATRPGGTVLLVGMGTPVMTLPLGAAALREVDLRGVFRYSNTYPEAVELVSRHDPEGPDFAKLVTHRFKGFEQAEKAFQMAGRTKDDDGKLVIKVVIEAGEAGEDEP